MVRRPVPLPHGGRGANRTRRRRRRVVVAALVVLAVWAAIILGGGLWLRGQVEQTIAARIVDRSPGAKASVHIGSFPLLWHLAVSGTVLEVSANVEGLSAGPLSVNGVQVPLAFDRVDIKIDDLHVRRDRLFHREVVIDRVRLVKVTATITQETFAKLLRVPVSLGHGMVGVGGLSLPAHATIRNQQVTVIVPGLATVAFPVPSLSYFPCGGTVEVVPGALQVSCTLHSLPPVLSPSTFHF